jgi:hypothetical protein
MACLKLARGLCEKINSLIFVFGGEARKDSKILKEFHGMLSQCLNIWGLCFPYIELLNFALLAHEAWKFF